MRRFCDLPLAGRSSISSKYTYLSNSVFAKHKRFSLYAKKYGDRKPTDLMQKQTSPTHHIIIIYIKVLCLSFEFGSIFNCNGNWHGKHYGMSQGKVPITFVPVSKLFTLQMAILM